MGPADHVLHLVELVRSRQWKALARYLGSSRVWTMNHYDSAKVFVEASRRWFTKHPQGEFYTQGPVTVREHEGAATARSMAYASWRGEDGCREDLGIGIALELTSTGSGTWKPATLSLSRGTKIHAGCGPDSFFPRLLHGWINLDTRHDEPGYGAIDLLSEWPFEEGSAAAVYSEDFIEHLDQREQLIFLGEALRVLQPGGVLRTCCPSLNEEVVRERFFTRWPHTGVRTVDNRVEWAEWGHRLIPTYEYLAHVLDLVGFVQVSRHQRHWSDIPAFPGDKRPLEDRHIKHQLYVEVAKPMQRLRAPSGSAGRRARAPAPRA
jgi:predicted SAM-dependent methyltransferase